MSGQVESFLKEYEALCLKHSLALWACGCCGSPSVTVIDDEQDFMGCVFEPSDYKDPEKVRRLDESSIS